jgi:hypothetical protein
MSVTDYLEWALDVVVERALSATDAHVLLILAAHANVKSGGWARPGRTTLMAEARRGRTAVDAALVRLRAAGLIEHRPAAPGRVAEYRLVTGRPVTSDHIHAADATDPPVTSNGHVTGPPVTSALTRPERDRNVTGPPVTEQGTENREPP